MACWVVSSVERIKNEKVTLQHVVRKCTIVCEQHFHSCLLPVSSFIGVVKNEFKVEKLVENLKMFEYINLTKRP